MSVKYGFSLTDFHETRSKSTDFTFSFSIELYWNRRKNGEIQVNILFASLNKELFLIAPIFMNLARTQQSFVGVFYIEPYPARPNRLTDKYIKQCDIPFDGRDHDVLDID